MEQWREMKKQSSTERCFFSSVFLRSFRRYNTELNLNEKRNLSTTLGSHTMTTDMGSNKGSLSKHDDSERSTAGSNEQLPITRSDVEDPNNSENENENPTELSSFKTEFMRKRSLQLSGLSPETFVPKVRRSQSDTQTLISSTSTSRTPFKSFPEDGGILPHIKGEKDAIKRITPHTVSTEGGVSLIKIYFPPPPLPYPTHA